MELVWYRFHEWERTSKISVLAASCWTRPRASVANAE